MVCGNVLPESRICRIECVPAGLGRVYARQLRGCECHLVGRSVVEPRLEEPSSTDPIAIAVQEGAEDTLWAFGSFVIWQTQRRIESPDRQVRLGPRSFDLLLALVQRHGEYLSKEELLSSVWKGVIVEEASVRVHMSLIRKALGEPGSEDGCQEWISNVPLRGYRFNGRVTISSISGRGGINSGALPFAKLPSRLTSLVGREEVVLATIDSLGKHRLVTLVGPGGIGKTSLAVCVAKRLGDQDGLQVGFIDLAPLISREHVLGTMARAVGVAADLPGTLDEIAQTLSEARVLLLIDNCEHVADTLAPLLGQLLIRLPELRILATSRETLRLVGECVVRVPALGIPEEGVTDINVLRESPSVELLLSRSESAGVEVGYGEQGPYLARIARQLEGIPLAIEIAAARLGTQSARDLADRLQDHSRLLTISNRGAVGRHSSISAAIDWSIELLDEREAKLLRALSTFRASFDVEAVVSMGVGRIEPDDAYDALSSLVEKSLVMFDPGDHVSPYRLLDATRAHAAKLAEQRRETADLLALHADHMLDTMQTATAALPSLNEKVWADRYTRYLDDVRYALVNSLASSDRLSVAAKLLTSSSPLWFQVSQVAEYRDRVATTLSLVERLDRRNVEMETWLATALIISLLHTDGLSQALDEICDRAIAGAQVAKSRVLELQARWGRCTYDMFRGSYSDAIHHAETLQTIVRAWSDPAALNLSHRVSAMANHFCGRFQISEEHSQASLRLSELAGRTRTNMVGVDPVVAAQALLARTQWIRGDSEAAMATSAAAVRHAQEKAHPVSLCSALYGACPVAIWSERYELAAQWIALMRDEARRRGLVGWLRYAEWYQEGLDLRTANLPKQVVLRINDLLPGYDPPHKEMLATFNLELVDEELVERVRAGEGLWCAAEVWRGLGLRHHLKKEVAEAEAYYMRAFETAKSQGALAWQRRATTSLLEFWTEQHGIDSARGLIGKLQIDPNR